MTIVVGKFNPDLNPEGGTTDPATTARGPPREGRRPRRRPLVRARRLARARPPPCARGWPRPATTSSWVELGRDGSWSCDGEEVALRAGRRAAGRRRGLPGAARALRRGRHRAGPARAARRALRRLGRAGQRAVHGQGPLQGRHGPRRAAAGRLLVAGRRARASRWPIRRRSSYPCWVKPARLGSSVGIARVDAPGELEAAIEAAAAHDPRVIVEATRARASRSSARCSGPPTRRRPASRARSCSPAARTAGTTTRPSTRRAAWSSSCRRGSPTRRASACASWPSPPSAWPAAAAWRAPTSSSTATTCCSTSSTRCPASRRRASTASSGTTAACPTPSSATAWCGSPSSASSASGLTACI